MPRRPLRVLPLVLPLASAWACTQAPEPEPPPLERVTSLARLAREGGRRSAAAPGLEVWELDEGRAGIDVWRLGSDSRVVVTQRPPNRLRLGPIPSGGRCALRFGMSVGGGNRGPAPSGGPVDFSVVLEDGDVERDVFEETVESRPNWIDREVALPPITAQGFHLRLVTSPVAGKSGEPPPAGWSAPHVACEVERPSPSTEGTEPTRTPIILISIDTLRPDHLGVYGYERPTSPVLDAFAEESLVFDNAFATAPWTLPTHASMLTGLYPEEHGAGHASLDVPLAERFSTVPELLARAGYRTLAFTAGALVTRARGLHQGFAEWTEAFRPNLGSVLPEVLDALGRAEGEPIFLFLHTYDVHAPYGQPPGYQDLLDEPTSTLELDRTQFERRLQERASFRRLAEQPHNAMLELGRFRDRAEMVAAYDSGIRFVDAQLGRLFDHLRALSLFDEALIIVTSDHGESLLDQESYIGHAHYLYDVELRIPLIVRVPGGERRGRVEGLVDQVDLASLILETAGVEPPNPLSGASPLARLDGRAPERRYVRGEASYTGARFARTERWKLITATLPSSEPGFLVPRGLRERFVTEEQLFDLSRDPEERKNLLGGSQAPPEAMAELRGLIEAVDPPALGAGSGSDPDAGFSEAEREQLRALGYLE